MGWGWLAPVLGAAGALFTGGATLPLMGLGAGTSAAIGTGLGAAGGALGALGKGRVAKEKALAEQQVTQDAQRQRLYDLLTRNAHERGQQLADRARFQLAAPNIRADQAVTGDLLHNLQDVYIPNTDRVKVQHFSGGLRPSALGENARQAGAALSALGRGQLGKDTYDIPDLPIPPELTHLADPGGGKLGDILGTSSLALQFLDELRKRRDQPPPNNPVTYPSAPWQTVNF